MNRLELVVFKAERGLSVALIERPERYVTLIDLGLSSLFSPLERLIVDLHVRPNILYITHPHPDHLADVGTAINARRRPQAIHFQQYDWADVKARANPGTAHLLDDFRKLIKLLPFRDYGGSGELTSWAYSPDLAKDFGEANYVNNSSLLLVYSWRDFKIAIAGDLQAEAISAMIGTQAFQEAAKDTKILIPPHHGHERGFPAEWVAHLGNPYVSIIPVQERDPQVDARYNSAEFAKGVTFNGSLRPALTTSADGSIFVSMWYDELGKPAWTFANL